MKISNKAYKLAAYYHEGQMYGEFPYLHHLNYVYGSWYSLFLLEPLQCDPDFFEATCYLHDILEDCPEVTTELLLSEGIPQEVVDAVVLVTKVKDKFYDYHTYLKNLSTNKMAWQVKVADTYSNLTQSVKEGNVRRIKKYSKQLGLLFEYKDYEEK